MVDFPNAELTSVPYGNANDFVRAFGDDAKPAFRDLKKLSTAPSFPVDIIKCGTNYALNEANIGVIGQTMLYANAILRNANRQWVKKVTPHIYTAAGLRAMFNKDVLLQHYSIKMDGEDISGTYGNIHFSNGPCNGGVMTPSPYAVPDDGLLNVIFNRSRHVYNIIHTIHDYESGRFEKHNKQFTHSTCRIIELQSEQPLYVELDGEAFLAKEMKLELIPGGIKFFAPEGMGFAAHSYKAYNQPERSKK
jgi:diacylglycerol kinase family enzyme